MSDDGLASTGVVGLTGAGVTENGVGTGMGVLTGMGSERLGGLAVTELVD